MHLHSTSELFQLANKWMLYGLILISVFLGVSTGYFYYRYHHVAESAKREQSNLKNEISGLDRDNANLQSQKAGLTEALKQTKAALAEASKPFVSTKPPTPKDFSPTAMTSSAPLP